MFGCRRGRVNSGLSQGRAGKPIIDVGRPGVDLRQHARLIESGHPPHGCHAAQFKSRIPYLLMRLPGCSAQSKELRSIISVSGLICRSDAMAKELIARHNLERKAMLELRAFPDGEHITEIEIKYQVDKVLKTNWIMNVFTSDGANMDCIQHAIEVTQHRLRQRYELRSEA
jgi:hypothetical protein